MGLTYIEADIANPAKPRQATRLEFLIDTGAWYSVVPANVLRSLGVRPHSRRSFILADGSKITRKIGDVLFRLDGRRGASPVIFGEKGDSVLMGTVSLEALGLMIDPLKRELRELPMMLAGLGIRCLRFGFPPKELATVSATPESPILNPGVTENRHVTRAIKYFYKN